ncbi:MAG: ABC transporter substrate-binding protein [Afipia sp.]|nr:ABC transporter substrate-binding protein [Afipia sp.]OJW60245.1 MAG: ABC transporter substrate-binding protein [Afipia sp. 64-13]
MTKKTSVAARFGWIVAGLCAAGSLAAALPARAADAPRRVVSFNLCADQLLLTLADPSQITALSPYALDDSLSVTTKAAAPFPRVGWDAESVINLSPDLVLAGPTDRPTRAMLDAAGLRVVEVAFVTNLAQAGQQAREIGALLGHADRGAVLAQQLAQAQAQLAAAALKPPRTAAIVQRGGYAEGSASLITAMLTVAGLRPLAAAPGGFGGFVSMETLLVDGPDVLVLLDPPREAADQGALFITHPALRARYDARRRIDLSSRYTMCGGPALVQGLDRLREALTPLR